MFSAMTKNRAEGLKSSSADRLSVDEEHEKTHSDEKLSWSVLYGDGSQEMHEHATRHDVHMRAAIRCKTVYPCISITDRSPPSASSTASYSRAMMMSTNANTQEPKRRKG